MPDKILTNFHFVFWTALTIMVVAPALGYCWASVRRAEIQANLKHEMIVRGMSADDVARVLDAGTDRR